MGADRGQMGPAGNAKPHPRLLIVSDVRLFSEGLAEVLERHSLLVAGYCLDAREVLSKLSKVLPDIVLLDASMPEGLALVKQVRRLAPKVLVVVLALKESAETVITWAEAGVAGYIPKTTGLVDVVATLVGIEQGEQVCSPAVAAGLIRHLHVPIVGRNAVDQAPPPALTARETQIVQLISDGLSNKDIARRLHIGVSTTKSHVHNLLTKLDVQRRDQAVTQMCKHRNG